MANRVRIWLGMSASVLVGASALSSVNAPPYLGDDHSAKSLSTIGAASAAETGPGGEGGEGGEGGIGGLPAPVAKDFGLLMVLGHLEAAMAQRSEEMRENGLQHFAHPSVEVVPGLTELDAALATKLSSELDPLLKLASEGGSEPDIAAGHAKVRETALAAESPTTGDAKTASAALIAIARQSAHEYQEAFHNGALVNLAEYQDGWGFTQSALSYLQRHRAQFDAVDAAGAQELADALTAFSQAWPSVMQPAQPKAPGEVTALASRVELAANRFR
jgi:hypothetical protein